MAYKYVGLGQVTAVSGVAANPSAPPLSMFGIPSDAVPVSSNPNKDCSVVNPAYGALATPQPFYSASSKSYYCGPSSYTNYGTGAAVVSSGGFLGWVQANPVLAAGAAVALFLLVKS